MRFSLFVLVTFSVMAHSGETSFTSTERSGQKQSELRLSPPVLTAAILTNRLQSDVDCSELSDIPATYVCLTKSDILLEDLMGRISYFVEGHAGRVVVSENDNTYRASPQARYAGHDIMAVDFGDFYSEVDKNCPSAPSLCLNSLEQSLRSTVIADAVTKKNYTNYVVIAATVGFWYTEEVISHEVLHARFFLNQKYQHTVKEFWEKSVSSEDRGAIREVLARTYNLDGANGELLLLNEFQAYLLQKDALGGKLGYMASKYQRDLAELLRSRELLPRTP